MIEDAPYARQELASDGAASPGRARRLASGWSASLFQMVLGLIQQVALIPVFLHFWTSDVLAAWLVIYAIGNLILIADSGLQFRAINRFLAFKSIADCDGRTAQFYTALRKVYAGLSGVLAAIVLACAALLSPSSVFGFPAVAGFDASFVVMTAGILLTLPVGVVTALYRARGLYGRAVWLQSLAVAAGQVGQLVAIAMSGGLLAVTTVFVVAQVTIAIYLVAIDAPLRFPFLREIAASPSPRWIIGQFRKALPFGLAGATELALTNLPVLLVSALVSDHVAVAQWGLTRVVAGLLRTLCVQATLPLASELGHDFAVGDHDRLGSLYARGSVLVALLASSVVAGLLPFWQDFFALWTHDSIPFDALLTKTLLLGTAAGAPAILALSYANYSGRGALLLRTKGLQLGVFLVLSVALIPAFGPLGAALAIVASDLGVQSGLLTLAVMRQTLQHPLRHVLFLAATMVVIVVSGWGVGLAIRAMIPWTGWPRLVTETTLWLIAVALVATPLTLAGIRARLIAAIPR